MTEEFPPKSGDPIHFESGRWYFWDETWSMRFGPYKTEQEARDNLVEYSRIELEGTMSVAEVIAMKFHNAYEALAPSFGYETRKESAKPWFEVPDKNKKLMIAVAQKLLDDNSIRV